MLQPVLSPGMVDNPPKSEETWKMWEHQVGVYENLAGSKLDDDVKVSVAATRSTTKTSRQLVLVNSQQFDNDYTMLRSVIQTYLNSNNSWIANDLEVTREGQTWRKSTTWPRTAETEAKAKEKAKGERHMQRHKQRNKARLARQRVPFV